MLLRVVEVPSATTAMKLATILLFEIFLRGSRNGTVLRGMMVKFHSHALQLACFLREPLMFFPEFMLIPLFGVFPLMRPSVQSGSVLRCGLSVLMSLLTTKVKSGHSKLFLLSSESQRESFLIQVDFVLETVNFIPSLVQIIISMFECECKLAVLVDYPLLVPLDMLKLPAGLFLPDLNPLSLFVFILIIVVSELLLAHEFPFEVASLLPQLEESLL
jgi:hypothetical protein